MDKPNKKIIEKLKLLSELSYDNCVTITAKGNYLVRLNEPTKVDVKNLVRPETVTKGTYSKLLTTVHTKYETHQRMLMLTKNGKLLVSKPLPTQHSFTRGVSWTTITPANYRKNRQHLVPYTGLADYSKEVKISKALVFFTSKAKWLLDCPFFTEEGELQHKILLNYSSITELRKDLGYTFLTDKTFKNLLTNLKEVEDHFKAVGDPVENETKWRNMSYINKLFNVLLYGKFFSLQSRKNLIIVLLNVLSCQDEHKIDQVLYDLEFDINSYIKMRQVDKKSIVELPSDLKELTLALAKTEDDEDKQESDEDSEEDLPF